VSALWCGGGFALDNIVKYVFSPHFLTGAVNTLELSIMAQIAGVLIGFLLALAKTSRYGAVRFLADGYIWLFRGIPVLLLLIFVYNALPQFGVRLNEFKSALVALMFNEAAYMAEIIRSGLGSVGAEQQRAGYVLGLTKLQIMRYITMPQALRVIIPPTANQFIGMLKLSSLASVIGFGDLLLVAQQVAGENFDYVNTLVAVAVYYLFFTAIFTLVQIFLEKSMDISRKAKNAAEKAGKNARDIAAV
jgi:polar amino acid transport system permease protein